ncbi:MAC/perforin domain protein [Carpediemonas membranifera]|uniref:MAC/perforin domain protein n=1 Tax=Carpediemonas membranifera TaxID=201153 RepID=A0A8J6AWT5_9EUKA|nr:MAC/perforin domain protein [Carpediemonas membranifera]|eukprot:KAG9396133.1 MAC/perforin domain protein [Carpediemonas membranifera]
MKLLLALLLFSLVLADQAAMHKAAAAAAVRYCNAYVSTQRAVCLKRAHSMFSEDEHQALFSAIEARNGPVLGLLTGRVGIALDYTSGAMGLPVLHMTPSKQVYGDQYIPLQARLSVKNNAESIKSWTYKNYDDYYNSLSWNQANPHVDSAAIIGGMMSHSTNMKAIYDKYFNGLVTLAVTHAKVTSYTLEATSGELDPYFQSAVAALGNSLDSTYDLFIQYWGTHTTVQADFGGLMEQQTLIRSCIWSAMDNNKLMQELNNELAGKAGESSKKPDQTYVNYRRLGTSDILGGNPEISNWAQRKASFIKDPVVISYNVRRISNYIPDAHKRQLMDQAITNHMNKAIAERQKEKAAADAAHAAWWRGGQSVSGGLYYGLYHSISGVTGGAQAVQMGHVSLGLNQNHDFPVMGYVKHCHKHCHWFHCHTHCNTNYEHLSAFGVPITVTCQRNGAGQIRSVASISSVFSRIPQTDYVKGVIRAGPWVSDGCSTSAPYNPRYEHAHGIADNSINANFGVYWNQVAHLFGGNWPAAVPLAAYSSGVCCIQRGLITVAGGTKFSDNCPAF